MWREEEMKKKAHIWKFKKLVEEKEVTYSQIMEYLKLRESYLESRICGLERSKKLFTEWGEKDEIEMGKIKSRRREISELISLFNIGKKHFNFQYHFDKLKNKLENLKNEP